MKKSRLPLLLALVLPFFLSGCDWVLFNAQGDVAAQKGHLVIVAALIMLIIVVPVLFFTLFFAWKYRDSNAAVAQEYDPDWNHSTKLELLIWSVPLLIIIVLGALTWLYTHKLDPYRPLDRISATKPLPADVKPLVVEVVAMDWKWLFVYPEQGIATVNELAAPVDRPIHFKLTATTTMNSFYVPDLAGMVYAMPGMETQLNAVINAPGVYVGKASHYSGSGFAGMHFKFHGLSQEGFDGWVAKAQANGQALSREQYLALVKPSERDPVQYFSSVDASLYDAVLNRCVEPGSLCMDEIMARDKARMAFHSRARNMEAVGLANLDSLLSEDVCTTTNIEESLLVLAEAKQSAPTVSSTN